MTHTTFQFLVPRGMRVEFKRRFQLLHALWYIRDVADYSYNMRSLFACMKFIVLGYTGFINEEPDEV